MQADPAALGDVADAGIGQSLGQHGVAGPGERGERDHDRLMRAAGDDRALRRCIEPDPGDPARGGRAMLRKALLGRIRPEVGGRARMGRDLGETLGNERAVASVRRAIDRELDQVAGAVAHRVEAARQGSRAPHESAAPDLAGHQAAFGGQRIGTADRADGHTQAISKIALRRQARALRQAPVGDFLGQRVDQRAIARAWPGGKIGCPHCHGDNIIIDSRNESRLFRIVAVQQGVQPMNTQDCTHTMVPRGRSVPALLLALAWFARGRFGQSAGRIAEIGMTWLDRARQRRRLAELSDHMLRDIGLTRADAWAEVDKPFWRP